MNDAKDAGLIPLPEVIIRLNERYLVLSSDKTHYYHVKHYLDKDYKEQWTCDCQDNLFRAPKPCKHIIRAIKEALGRPPVAG